MPTSEHTDRVKLTIHAGDPETEIFVLDGRFLLEARGVGSLTAELDPGLYKVKLVTGPELFEEDVVLREGDPELVRSYDAHDFLSPAPLDGTTRTHEYQMVEATRHSRIAHVTLGQGSSIFVFARDWTAEGWSAAPPGGFANPAAGLALVRKDETTADGGVLVDFETASAKNLQGGDPWAACNVRVDPGVYRLRLAIPDRGRIEQTVVASPGWQTQIFFLQRDYATGRRSVAGSDPTARRADLAGASIQLAPGEGFAVDDRMARHVELARLALIGKRRVVAGAIREMLRDKFDNPMLGLFGAHLLLLERERDVGLLQTVVANLGYLLGPHPDVQALATALDRYPPAKAFGVPPMLRRSWSLAVKATVSRPDLVPPDSLAASIAERLLREDPWLIWRSPVMSREADDDEPSDLEAAVHSFIYPRTSAERRAAGAAPEAPAQEARSGRMSDVAAAGDVVSSSYAVPAGAADAPAPVLDDSQMGALAQSLEIPRAQLERVVAKVRQRPPRGPT